MVGSSGPSSRDNIDTRKLLEAARAKLDAAKAKRAKSPQDNAPQQVSQAPLAMAARDNQELATQVGTFEAQIKFLEGG